MELTPAEQQLSIDLTKALAVEMRRFGYGAISRASPFLFSRQDIEDIRMPLDRDDALPVRGASFDHGFQSTYRHVSHLLVRLGICRGLASRSGQPEYFRFLLGYDDLDGFLRRQKPWESFSLAHLAGAFFQCHGNVDLIERHGFKPSNRQMSVVESFCLAGYARRTEHGFEWLADEIEVQFEGGDPLWLGCSK